MKKFAKLRRSSKNFQVLELFVFSIFRITSNFVNCFLVWIYFITLSTQFYILYFSYSSNIGLSTFERSLIFKYETSEIPKFYCSKFWRSPVIFKFRNISRSTFGRSNFRPPLGMCTDVIEPVRTWHVKFGHVRIVRTVRTGRTFRTIRLFEQVRMLVIIRTTHHGWEPWYVDRSKLKQHLSGL